MEQQAELAMPELMARLATAMTTLANVSTMQLASNLSTTKTIMRPSPFLGK
jgi:biopolymer transport protein ExbB/TolQ